MPPFSGSGVQAFLEGPLTLGASVHPPGTLVETSEDGTIYLLQYRRYPTPAILRRPIGSPEVLRQLYDRPDDRLQFDESDVVLISEGEMQQYPLGSEIGRPRCVRDNGKPLPDGTLIRDRGGKELSIVTAGGHREPFAGEEALLDLGYRLENVVVVDDYDAYPPLKAAVRRPKPPGNLRISVH